MTRDPKLIQLQALRDQSWASLRRQQTAIKDIADGGPIDEMLARQLAHVVVADLRAGDYLVTSIEPLVEDRDPDERSSSPNVAPPRTFSAAWVLIPTVMCVAYLLVCMLGGRIFGE